MTAYLRYGRHEIECNHRDPSNGDSVQCGNKVGYPAENYSIDSALAAIESRGWKIVEPIVRDGGIHLCPRHAEESSVSDSSRVEIDASRGLATIRLRTATGRLYDIDVSALAERLVHGTGSHTTGLTSFTQVPTWEGVPIPDDLDKLVVLKTDAVAAWKRGVTDAKNAHLTEPLNPS